MTSSLSKTLHRFIGAFVDELARSGVGHACICPGSRSTPLALLLNEHPNIKVWSHLDERSAAYFALGMAKILREPVVVVSTSGTAAVNFAPAVVEANYSGVPLLLLTADRPPELRGVGALQTIDQQRLYGTHVKWYQEMLLPEASEEAIAYSKNLACRAVAIAIAERSGPVHLNCPFREPLIPVGSKLNSIGPRDRAYVHVTQSPRRPSVSELAPLVEEIVDYHRGLIICGPQDDDDFPQAVTSLAVSLKYPVLADPISQVRCGLHYSNQIISNYDAFLRNEHIIAELEPELVIRFGSTPISKPLLQYLQYHRGAYQCIVDSSGEWSDPGLAASRVVHADPRSFCETFLATRDVDKSPQRSDDSDWLQRWQDIAAKTSSVANQRLSAGKQLSEPGVFIELADLLPEGSTLFTGNSMPIRDLDSFFPGGRCSLNFLANRGVSGIDGVISSALGASAVANGALLLVIGDLSFYHDMNGLLAAKRHDLRATIVLLNNDGGGIFSFLPQADQGENFEKLFGTPHGLNFRPVAEMYGLGYQRPESKEEFRSVVEESLAKPGVDIIEVATKREENVDLHREVWDMVSCALASSKDERL